MNKKVIYCRDLEEQKTKYEEHTNNNKKLTYASYLATLSAFKEIFPEAYRDNYLVDNMETRI